MRSARSSAGQRAMQAYRRQRELAFAAAPEARARRAPARSAPGRARLIFTQDNATAYEVSRRFLVPVITHQTKVRERSEILSRFAEGNYGAIATSKVLNEGVDVPDASVAIVISGSGCVREHVQRLGRSSAARATSTRSSTSSSRRAPARPTRASAAAPSAYGQE